MEARGSLMTVRILVAVVALTVATAFSQTPDAEIAGRMRMSDEQRSDLPGVRITISDANQTQEVVSDRDGRFLFPSLRMGTYHVVADLVGFNRASGEITLSPSTPRAFLAWSLEAGCLSEVQRVVLTPREAARLVEAIVHIRVVAASVPALMSGHPACPGRVLEEYRVQVMGSVPGRAGTDAGRDRLFIERQEPVLTPGHEYVALLWPDGYTTSDLILPVTAGRVVSPHSGALQGMRPDEALSLLAKWSQGRRP